MFRKIVILSFAFTLAQGLPAQVLEKISLEEAYDLLESNYPILRNEGVLNEVFQLEMEQLDKNRLPELFLRADGMVQSEAPKLVVEGFMLPIQIDRPLYSAKAYAEVRYNFLHGRSTKAQRTMSTADHEAELRSLEVDRYALRSRIDQLFLGIRLLRERSVLIELSLSDLSVRKERVEAGVQEGVLLESELKQLEVRELELNVLKDNLEYRILGYIKTLSQLTGRELSADLEVVFPALPDPLEIPPVQRPELALFEAKRDAVLARSEIVDALRQPRLSAYAQGGVGYPNPLNFLDDGFAPYGLLGMQFSWKITDWKKSKTDKQILSLQAEQLRHAEETFEFNLQSAESVYFAEVSRLQALIRQDEAIASLQAEILEQFAAQLDEGVITSSEYVTQVNTELNARQNLVIHKTELLRAQLEFWNERGGN